MEQINFYLKKFENLEIKGDKLKEEVIKILKENFNIDIEKEEIKLLKNGNIKINKIGAQKSLIFLNKNKIKKVLEKEII